MAELIRELIGNPIYTLILILAVWLALYLLLSKVIKLGKLGWIKLEYFWIVIGILGFLTVVAENGKQLRSHELETINTWIKNDFLSLNSYTKNHFSCFYKKDTKYLTEEEASRRFQALKTACEWTKEIRNEVETAIESGYVKIENLPTLNLEGPDEIYDYIRIMEYFENINQNLERKDELVEKINDNSWKNIKFSLGIFALIFAFSIKLAILTYKISEEKRIQSKTKA